MGYGLDALCQCGFKDYVLFGVGFEAFLNHFNTPAISKRTKKLVTTNIEKPNASRYFNFYTDPKMFKLAPEINWIEFGEYKLSYDGNFCPGCGEFTMRFELGVLWD